MKGVVFYAVILHCKAILGQGKHGLNKIYFSTSYAPGSALITRPVDLQSSMLPLCYDYPLWVINTSVLYFSCTFLSCNNTTTSIASKTGWYYTDEYIESAKKIGITDQSIYPHTLDLVAIPVRSVHYTYTYKSKSIANVHVLEYSVIQNNQYGQESKNTWWTGCVLLDY